VSDEALREAERRWRSSQALDDGVAWMQLRLRTGDRAAVELLAEIGDPAARAALPETKWLEPDKWVKTLDDWLDRIAARGHQPLVRTHIALARLGWVARPIVGGEPGELALRHALEALLGAERWAVASTSERAEAAWPAVEAATAAIARARGSIREFIEARCHHSLIAAAATADPTGSRFARLLDARRPELAGPRWMAPQSGLVRLLVQGDPVHATRDVVRAELLPWALGERDPVAERVRPAAPAAERARPAAPAVAERTRPAAPAANRKARSSKKRRP
jgi:hypothetical protein